MAGTKISALTAASALGGTEKFPAVQSAADVAATAAQIKTFASGWKVISAITPNAGVDSTITWTSIASTYNDLLIVLEGISHNSAGNASVTLALTNDGSTWSASPKNMTVADTSAVALYGALLIPDFKANAGTALGPLGANLTSDNSLNTPSTQLMTAWRLSGGITGIRLALSASGQFDAGTATLLGR